MIKIGSYVSRKKYKRDIIFQVIDIKDKLFYLRAESLRLYADAQLTDLVEEDKELRANNDLVIDDLNDDKLVFGKVLHIDGDEYYLDKSVKAYKKYDVPIIGVHLSEDEMQKSIINLLVTYRPDILVITGHDAFKSETGVDEFKRRNNKIKTVLTARIYQPDKDALVIFAGACQSNYEKLIQSGANFASSPARVSINVLDPVRVAINAARTPITEFVKVEKVLNSTTNKQKGIGGIDTRGVARRIYMGE